MLNCAIVLAIAGSATLGAWTEWRPYRWLHPRPLDIVTVIAPWIAIAVLGVITAITSSPLGFAATAALVFFSIVLPGQPAAQ